MRDNSFIAEPVDRLEEHGYVFGDGDTVDIGRPLAVFADPAERGNKFPVVCKFGRYDHILIRRGGDALRDIGNRGIHEVAEENIQRQIIVFREYQCVEGFADQDGLSEDHLSEFVGFCLEHNGAVEAVRAGCEQVGAVGHNVVDDKDIARCALDTREIRHTRGFACGLPDDVEFEDSPVGEDDIRFFAHYEVAGDEGSRLDRECRTVEDTEVEAGDSEFERECAGRVATDARIADRGAIHGDHGDAAVNRVPERDIRAEDREGAAVADSGCREVRVGERGIAVVDDRSVDDDFLIPFKVRPVGADIHAVPIQHQVEFLLAGNGILAHFSRVGARDDRDVAADRVGGEDRDIDRAVPREDGRIDFEIAVVHDIAVNRDDRIAGVVQRGAGVNRDAVSGKSIGYDDTAGDMEDRAIGFEGLECARNILPRFRVFVCGYRVERIMAEDQSFAGRLVCGSNRETAFGVEAIDENVFDCALQHDSAQDRRRIVRIEVGDQFAGQFPVIPDRCQFQDEVAVRDAVGIDIDYRFAEADVFDRIRHADEDSAFFAGVLRGVDDDPGIGSLQSGGRILACGHAERFAVEGGRDIHIEFSEPEGVRNGVVAFDRQGLRTGERILQLGIVSGEVESAGQKVSVDHGVFQIEEEVGIAFRGLPRGFEGAPVVLKGKAETAVSTEGAVPDVDRDDASGDPAAVLNGPVSVNRSADRVEVDLDIRTNIGLSIIDFLFSDRGVADEHHFGVDRGVRDVERGHRGIFPGAEDLHVIIAGHEVRVAVVVADHAVHDVGGDAAEDVFVVVPGFITSHGTEHEVAAHRADRAVRDIQREAAEVVPVAGSVAADQLRDDAVGDHEIDGLILCPDVVVTVVDIDRLAVPNRGIHGRHGVEGVHTENQRIFRNGVYRHGHAVGK